MNLTMNWNYPTNIRVGAGRIKELPELCKLAGIRAPLIVTDPGLAQLSFISEIQNNLRGAALKPAVFSEVKSNPTGKNVVEGVTVYRNGEHDGVIALGGGSGLDAAKAIALMVGQTGALWDYEDIGDNASKVDAAGIAPIIAIPTTAGTGSEVGRASVITDEVNHVKRIIFHPKMLPSHVILDPELTVGLPPTLTAATGMDALSHNLEALCSPFYHPMGKGIAIEGIHLVNTYLERAFHDGSDIEARTHMLVASSMGATAFQKGLGAIHALAHPLGALYDAHHGTLNAILMPYVLVANQSAITPQIEQLGRYLGLANPTFSGFLDRVLELREILAIPNTLQTLHIYKDQAERVGQMAIADPTASGNPIQFSAADYQQIFTNAVDGTL